VAPDVTLGSVAIDLPHAFLTVAREVKEGRFKPRVIELGTKDDVVMLVLNPATRSRIPSGTLHLVDSLGAEMHAGRFAAPATRKQ
jgi:basic membrane lipoprotein Med (substrate-binding protein (PBP1-ABC) superfamily)